MIQDSTTIVIKNVCWIRGGLSQEIDPGKSQTSHFPGHRVPELRFSTTQTC